jgi:hypothetical protein
MTSPAPYSHSAVVQAKPDRPDEEHLMIRHRVGIVGTAMVAVAAGGLLATLAMNIDEPASPPFGSDRAYIEPPAHAVADDAYIGFIRALSADGEIVAVDFVSHEHGVVGNLRPEQLVHAGVLGKSGFFATSPQPFKLRVEGSVIVAVQSADDELDNTP